MEGSYAAIGFLLSTVTQQYPSMKLLLQETRKGKETFTTGQAA